MTDSKPHQNNAPAQIRQLRLWLLSANTRGHDVYKSAVVAAESEEEAKLIHPGKNIGIRWSDAQCEWVNSQDAADYAWARHPDLVTAREIGVAAPGVEAGVIIADFLNG